MRSFPCVLAIASLLTSACDGTSAPVVRGVPSAAFQTALKERAEVLDPRPWRIGKRAADLAFVDLDGRAGKLSDYATAKALVVFVRNPDCPVSKQYGPETARIEDDYRARGVAFLFVNPDEFATPEEARAEIELFGFGAPYVLDPKLAIARELATDRVPCAVVLDSARTLLYRGAIDDQYGRGTRRAEPTVRFLRDALEAVLADEDVAIKATTAPGCVLGIEESLAQSVPLDVTYHRDVARIVQSNCVECHREGGVGPFRLDTYQALRENAPMVRKMVKYGIMPPWFAAPDTGPWENDRRLSEVDKATLFAWIDQGLPEGDPADAPLPRDWKEGWVIGEPDLVFEIPEPFEVPAEGIVELKEFIAEDRFPEDVWIERMQIMPTAVQAVHHVVVLIRIPNASKEAGQMVKDTLQPWTQQREGWEFLFGYLPGRGPHVYREGTARFVPKGSIVRFVMHYTPKGKAVVDQTKFGVTLASKPPRWIAMTRMLKNESVFIPAGADGVSFTTSYRLPKDVFVRSFTPHMHLRGKAFSVEAILPDGERTRLLELPTWDQGWQFSYVFRDEPFFPRGTEIVATGWYDNSERNPDNPDPTVDVKNGPQTEDEMLMIACEWVTPRSAD